jgi:exodeoxyribonuclease V alpha subunit
MEESITKYTSDPKIKMDDKIKVKLNALKAQTIHRLLGYIRNSLFFRHNEKNPLPYDVVVIDEASMIDGAMMAKLLNAIGDKTIFYLIGDKDQLASVEAGSVFGDICRAKESALLKDKVEVKVKIYRAEGPEIIEFSKKLIEGETDYILNYENNNEVVIDKPGDGKFSDKLFLKEALLYKEYIKEENITEALKKLNLVRVLCVTREHDHSVAEANAEIEKLLKKAINDSNKFNPKAGFYHNQPIIITKNDDDLGLNNGDVGLIRKDDNGSFKFYYEGQDGELKSHPAGYLNYYETVFAMTIHKSQGSEFDHVVVMLPEKQARKLLTRELLYTAVTRAKKKVLVQSTPESLEHCLNNVVSRASGLTDRIEKHEKQAK